ncbi:MAG: hypothetical protein ABSD78_09580 [Acidimicrobiales bacterium]|jgi:hypothetical protein
MVAMLTVTVFMISQALNVPLSSAYSCSGKLGESLNVGQNTGSLFVGIIGSLTAPGPSQVDTSDDQALLLWLGMEEYSTPTGYYCDLDGELTHYCWTQVGLAMGRFGDPYCPGNPRTTTSDTSYEVYFERYDINGCADVLSTVDIDTSDAVPFQDNWTGEYIDGGYQYESQVVDSSDHYVEIGTGDLYYLDIHAEAQAEIHTGSDTTCPTLTDGSPYQHFGDQVDGSWDGGSAKLQVENSSTDTFSPWSTADGPSAPFSDSPYWVTEGGHWPADFQTNGPGGGPP